MEDKTRGAPEVARIVAELDERGYCVIPAVISTAAADRARAVLERLLAEEATDATRRARSQRVARIAVKHPIFLELMAHPLIVAIWQTYLDPDVICSTWTANTTYPGYDRIGWHPDFPYQWLNQPWPSDRISGQTIWMLDDFTDRNGGTGLVPYSHREATSGGGRGSVLVMHGANWHTARPNRSGAPRSALLGMYTRPIYLTQEDMPAQLADLDNPSELVRQLMGANRHRPGVVGAGQ